MYDIVRGVKRHIGIYSGTFDPVHKGHISFALEAIKNRNLDEVVFLPERRPREKSSVSDISHRITTLKQAIHTIPKLSVVRLSSEQFTTKDTLPELKTMFPDASFTLLLGSDVVRTFTYRWQDLDILLSSVTLAIGMRNNEKANEIVTILTDLEKTYHIKIDYTLIYTEHGHLASTHIRKNQTN
ncbi:MAG: Cytidyltransferase-related protein [Candidatus Saccharibacteria bacterium]|nr:Cytidyltransferase-related protein [Candidatus Saccharibacteria bacterium]